MNLLVRAYGSAEICALGFKGFLKGEVWVRGPGLLEAPPQKNKAATRLAVAPFESVEQRSGKFQERVIFLLPLRLINQT